MPGSAISERRRSGPRLPAPLRETKAELRSASSVAGLGRGLAQSGAMLVVLACVAGLSHAQPGASALPGNYPNKPIRIIVGSASGGGADIISRAVAQKLADLWGRSVIVDNRPGGGGVVAIELLARAAPDGYTLFGGASLIVTATPLKKVPFDTRKVLAPIVQMTSVPYLMVSPPSLPANSVKELIAYAKSRPGALSYGSAGIGSIAHLGTELFSYMAGGLDMVHVPYKGFGQAFTDLMGSQIQILFSSGIGAAPYLKSGRLKAIGVTSLRRLQNFPDVPTVAESGVPGFELDNMHGLYAPAGVPPAILFALNREVGQFMNTPEMKRRLAADGAEAAPPNSPAEFKRVFAKQIEMWERFIRTSGIKIAD